IFADEGDEEWVGEETEDASWEQEEETTETWEESYGDSQAETQEEYYEETQEESYEEETGGEESWTSEEVSEEEYSGEDSWESDEYSGEYYEGSETEGEDSEKEKEEELDKDGKPKPYVDTSKPPTLYSKSVAVYCRNTGEIIFARNRDKKVSPYSVTKLLTALLAVQRLPMDQKVTVSADAASQEGSTMHLLEGEVVTVEQLLYGTLILSGNDAAYALAEAVSGDIDSFVKLMNDTAANMGCKNTHFDNCNGLSDDVNEHYTTAKDMMDICKVVFANETVNKIAGTVTYDMPATNMSDKREMKSHNDLLVKNVPGFVSGKTGWWDEQHATVAMNYKNEGLDLIVVIFESNEERRWTDCENLVKYATANIQGVTVFPEGEIIGKVRVRHGAETIVDARTQTECVTYLPKAASEQLIRCDAIMYDDVTAPIREGDIVGKYKVYVANELIDEVNLVAAKGIKEGWLPSYVGISNKATLIGGGVLLLLLLLIITRIIAGARQRRLRKLDHKAKVRAMARKQLEDEKKEFDSHRGKFYR
ncbi:MAG: D-alanyl-D-alanine carboxypeptidase, partial [Firmicutes bacterium]|nr:D-alanyl-D-alanine carboxypeptidase [Bacillota bacterium]